MLIAVKLRTLALSQLTGAPIRTNIVTELGYDAECGR
jgi:hypothetical protein